jgi:3-ketosteroid 9alpha-monooxygenase subunit B
VAHWLDVLQGPPCASGLRELARPYSAYDAYVCGPDPYMAVAREALRDLAVPAQRVHVERFLSLAENPFEAAPAEEQGGVTASLSVELDDKVHQLEWVAGRRMLDVMLEAGLDAPYSCREGICGACACRLVSGEVEMAHNEVLEAEDLSDGWILACQSIAQTSQVAVSYD